MLGSVNALTELLFEIGGVEVFQRDRKYFVRYDYGGIASSPREVEISAEDVAKARKGWQDLYEVILNRQRQDDGSSAPD